jgi:hypothetical protein
MASIWEATADITQLVQRIKKDHHHPRLAQASIWVLISDGKGVVDNRIITVKAAKCTKHEKLSTGHDFKLTIMAETWANLTDAQRDIAVDEALCRCGVKYIPQTVEVNGKKEMLKDDWGRVLYTDQISFDNDGNPRWKINKPDAELFFSMLTRHGEYDESAENTTRALNRQPLKQPMVAQRADDIDAALEEEAA